MLLAPLVVAGLGAWLLRPARVEAAARTEAPTDTVARGIWIADCAVCHGDEGKGTQGFPSLRGVGKAAIDYELTTGRMPLPPTAGPNTKTHRHKPAYDEQTITRLVEYVSTLTGGGPAIPVVTTRGADVAEGGEQFRLQCAACHAWGGDGGALVHREAPALHRATPVQVAEAVRVGPGTMPAFGQAALDDHQLSSVVAYVRYLAKPRDRGGQALWHLGPLAEGAIAWIVGIGLLILATLWIGEREPTP